MSEQAQTPTVETASHSVRFLTTAAGGRSIRLCVIINPSFGLTLPYGNRWLYLRERGFVCTAVAGSGPEHEMVAAMGVRTKIVAMERYPSPVRDFASLVRLWWYLLFHRFDLIEVSTPKASFLGAMASWLSGHRRILYLVRGRAYEHMRGIRRWFMNMCEWLTCRAAMRVVPISRELAETLVREGLCPPGKISVVGSGSSKGLDFARFHRGEDVDRQARQLRAAENVGGSDIVILAVGWLRRDKGVNELVEAFQRLVARHPNVHLFLLGDFEPSDPLAETTRRAIVAHQRIHHLPRRTDPVPVYAAADIVAFPSWREGFGNVPLEAGAMGLPVVASDIMGCREAVRNGVTGLLVRVRDSEGLLSALARLVEDPALRQQLGEDGQARVEREFRQERIWDETIRLFHQMLGRVEPSS